MAKRKSKKLSLSLIITVLVIAIIIAAAFWYIKSYRPDIYDKYLAKYFTSDTSGTYEIAATESFECALLAEGELKIHFLELGNDKAGDCIYIQAGGNDILVDAGSDSTSISAIKTYLDGYITDGTLEYVIVTHAHEDHYAGFASNDGTDSIFDLYECETVIGFAKTNKKENSSGNLPKMHANWLRELDEELNGDGVNNDGNGSVYYSADWLMKNEKSVFKLAEDIELQILDSYYYYNESDTENDYSVCFTINHGERRFLFTGDLEKEGEQKLVQMNKLDNIVLYKAGHHGSKTSSSVALMEAIKPQMVCVTCVAGSPEYTDVTANQFPTQQFIDNVSPHTDRVYVTSLWDDTEEDDHEPMNGTIVVVSSPNLITLNFTNNNVRLKDSEWFKSFRECPPAWR